MNLRHDAYAGAAEMALALEKIVREHPEDGMVGTVGRIEAVPGAVNIIPGRVLFTVDLRSLTDALRVAATERFAAEAARIAKTRGLTVSIEPFHEIATAPLRAGAAGRLGGERHRARPHADQAAVGRRPRRPGDGAALSGSDAVRALPRRHQSQPGRVHQRCRHGPRHCGSHQIHRTVQTMSDFIERNFAREVELLKALVRVPSDNPPGDCARHGEAAAKLFEGLGFKVERHPVPAEFVKKHGMVSVTNLVVRERFGSGKGPTIALNAHGDVVPPGQGWSHDPYGAEEKGGAIYGRGAAVSKSDFASYGFALLALKDNPAGLDGTVELHLTYDEESGGFLGPEVALNEGISKPDLALSAGFSYAVVTAHNGVLHLEVTVKGRQAHAALPESGADALQAATGVLTALYAERKRLAKRKSKQPGIGSAKSDRGSHFRRHQHQRGTRPHRDAARPAADPGGERHEGREGAGRADQACSQGQRHFGRCPPGDPGRAAETYRRDRTAGRASDAVMASAS